MPYDPQMSLILALAVDQAYQKYTNPNHQIQLGNYVVKAEIFVYEGIPPVEKKTFFGFAASGSFGAGYPVNNIVALRGTQTDEEGFYDLDWYFTPCTLGGVSCGNVATGLYDFYGGVWETTLGQSIQKAVKSLVAPSNNPPLYFTAHSLGGAMATLGALETAIRGSYPAKPLLYTFASLHVGDKTFAVTCAKLGLTAYRAANLADWVPSFTGMTADTPGYVHVGVLCSFLWQTDGDWANHSLEKIYLKVVQSYPQVVKVGPRTYPQ